MHFVYFFISFISFHVKMKAIHSCKKVTPLYEIGISPFLSAHSIG